MADHSLKSARHRRHGRPLPHHQANVAQAPQSVNASKERHPFLNYFHVCLAYAVLAQISLGCPPPIDRSPTCYSPVRHYTRTRRYFLVRLACVRHAASVHSEPGSNSSSKYLKAFFLSLSVLKQTDWELTSMLRVASLLISISVHLHKVNINFLQH